MRSLADVDGDGIVDSTDVYLAKIQCVPSFPVVVRRRCSHY